MRGEGRADEKYRRLGPLRQRDAGPGTRPRRPLRASERACHTGLRRRRSGAPLSTRTRGRRKNVPLAIDGGHLGGEPRHREALEEPAAPRRAEGERALAIREEL